ncbi:MAG: hypothetical protein HUU47_11010 [Bacteroidetes bacterium]|nr:hypothetical protein [Bacteroidota bacterium]
MKKLITITIVFFTLMSISYNENTGCNYTIKIYWDDGAGNCQNSASIWIPGSATTNLTNPWIPPIGGAIGVDVTCNNCGVVASIGDCTNVTCFTPCNWVCCYTHTCNCGSPVNYRFIPYFGFNNATLNIY